MKTAAPLSSAYQKRDMQEAMNGDSGFHGGKHFFVFCTKPKEFRIGTYFEGLQGQIVVFNPYSGTFLEKSINYRGSHDLVKICSRRTKW
jgi:hypothetical protein